MNDSANVAIASSERASALGIAIAQHEPGNERQRACDRLAAFHAGITCRVVRRDDARARSAARDGERPRRFLVAPRARVDLERKIGEKERAPEHGGWVGLQPPDAVRASEPVGLKADPQEGRRATRWTVSRTPELGQLRGAQVRLVGAEELVELRRRDRRAREHRVDLAAVVDLVLEQVREQADERLVLHAGPALYGTLIEVGIGEAAHSATRRRSTACCAAESAAHVSNGSSRSKKRHGGARLAPQRALERVDVVPVDREEVVERRLDRREEARARRDEVLRESVQHARSRRWFAHALLHAIVKR